MHQLLFYNDTTKYFDQSFEKLEISGTIQNKSFENCNFKHCNFNNSTFLNCNFTECSFTNCTINTMFPTATTFVSVTFIESKLMGINWTKGKWQQKSLTCPLSFYTCDISYSSFFGLNLANFIVHKCKAHDVDFREADLSSGNLTDTDFYQSLFIHTKLAAADFSNAINYDIDITQNDVKKAIFTFPDVINLLKHLEIKVNGLKEE